jgi:hypothetical protein
VTTDPGTTTSTTGSPDPTTGQPPGSSTNATNTTDSDCPFGQDAVFYQDEDGDGFGAGEPIPNPCFAPEGTAPEPGDCNDSDSAINPGQNEVCNSVDDDCDELRDEFSSANSSCGPCALGKHKGAVYWACYDVADALEAEFSCQSLGPSVHLAVADDIDEHTFLIELALASYPMPTTQISYWLGVARPMEFWNDCGAYPEAEAWLTIAGTVPTHLAWRIGEPNNSMCDPVCVAQSIADEACPRENCIEMVTPDTGAWNDLFCGSPNFGYLCEQFID